MKNIIKSVAAATVGTLAIGMTLSLAPNAQAQSFTSYSKGSAVRAAYSAVTPGGGAHSYAVEILNPSNVYSSDGASMIMQWADIPALGGNESVFLTEATLAVGFQETTGPQTLEAGMAQAIQDASAGAAWGPLETMFDRIVNGQYNNIADIVLD